MRFHRQVGHFDNESSDLIAPACFLRVRGLDETCIMDRCSLHSSSCLARAHQFEVSIVETYLGHFGWRGIGKRMRCTLTTKNTCRIANIDSETETMSWFQHHRGRCVTLRPVATNGMFKMSSQHGGMPTAGSTANVPHA